MPNDNQPSIAAACPACCSAAFIALNDPGLRKLSDFQAQAQDEIAADRRAARQAKADAEKASHEQLSAA